MTVFRVFLLILNLTLLGFSSSGQLYSDFLVDSEKSSRDADKNTIESLVPEDIAEVTVTLAKVIIYENAMQSNDKEVHKNQNYLYSISDLLKIKEQMNKEKNDTISTIDVKSNNIKGEEGNGDIKLKKLKPRYAVSVKSKYDSKGKLGDMTYHKKMFEKMLLETLFRLGQQNSDNKPGEEIILEVDGLVVDQTVSKIGRDFYEIFYSYWDPPVSANNYTVTIKELPPRMNRVSVSVIINDDEVFSSFLSPRADIIEAYAMYAIQLAIQYLVDQEDVSRTLEEGDMSGTGIF